MKNETDSKISAYLRLAELCGTGDEDKRKSYMNEVEKLLGYEKKTSIRNNIQNEVIKICDTWEKEGGFISLWILSNSYKDYYWSKEPFNTLDSYEINQYFFAEFIKRNLIISEDFEFGVKQGFSYEPSEKLLREMKECGWSL